MLNENYSIYDTLVIKPTKVFQLRVRLQIVSYLNDNRPLIIKKATIKEEYETEFKHKYVCGAPFDPMYNPNKLYNFPELRRIPELEPIRYEEVENQSNSSYLSTNQYLEIFANRTFILDLILYTKEYQHKLVCVDQVCSECREVEEAIFKKSKSIIELVVDKPNPNDNNEIFFDFIEIMELTRK